MEELQIKYEQFASVTSTNDDLEDLNNFNNLGYYDSKYWWAVIEQHDASSVNIVVKTAPSLTGSTTTETTENQAFVGTFENLGKIALHIYDNDIAILGVVYTDDGGTYNINFVACVSKDGGSTWNTDIFDINLNSNTYLDGAVHRGFYDTANTRFMFPVTFENSAGNLVIGMVRYNLTLNTITSVGLLSSNYLKNINSVYAGNWSIDDTLYYFTYIDSADNVRLMSFYGGFTDVETLTGISAPTSYNPQAQLYWRFLSFEIIMDEDHFYYRKIGETAWSSYSDSGSTTNAIIYDYDGDGLYTINYLVWKDTIYQIETTGAIRNLQTSFTDDAYVGWSDWFANGADTIYQVDKDTNLYAHTAICKTGYENPPSGQINGVSGGLAEKAYNIYDYEENLVQKQIVDKPTDRHSDAPTNNRMTTGIAKDLRRIVDIAAVASTAPHTYLTTYVFPLCEYIHEGTLDATQAARVWPAFSGKSIAYILRNIDIIYSLKHRFNPDYSMDWDDNTDVVAVDYKRKGVGRMIPGIVDVGTHLSPSLGDLTYSNANPLIQHSVCDYLTHKAWICMDDQDSSGYCLMIYPFTANTADRMEFFILNTDVTKGALIYFYSGATIAFRVAIQASKIQYYYGSAWNDATGGSVSNNIAYHFAVIFDTVTDTYSFELNGTELDSGIAFDNNVASLDKIGLLSSNGSTGYQIYFDAVGGTLCGQGTYVAGSNRYNGLVAGINPISQFNRVTDKYTVNAVYMRGAYADGKPSTGSHHGTTPGNYDMWVDLPEEEATDAKAEEIYDNHTQGEQEIYSGYIYHMGYLQYGKRVWFAREKGDTPTLFYIIDSTYDAAKHKCSVVISKYLVIPKREQTTQQNNRQLISNVESSVNDPTGSGISPRAITFSNQTAPDDPAEDHAILYVDAAGDLIIKVDVGGVLKTITIVDYSAS